jgi:hypothetical protein
VPEKLVPMIQAQSIAAEKPAHARHQIGVRSFDHEVKVIGHQAIRVNLKPRLVAGFGQSLEKILPIDIARKDALTTITTAHYMINRASILNSDFPGHAAFFKNAARKQVLERHSSTPFMTPFRMSFA